MEIVCFDMEGTLTPEIWEQVAKNTGIDEFNKTTRDIPINQNTSQLHLKRYAEL